jgi:Caspase domain
MRFIPTVLCFAVSVYFGISPSHAERRVALVIGNSDYQSTAALPNPANDAQDMAVALREVGFEVIVETNVNKRALETALAKFGRLSQGADAAVFYYAGHGIQYRGRNYLVPVDARLEDEFSVNYELTRIDDVLFAVSQASGVKLLILDACRNNPLADRLIRSTSRNIGIARGLTLIDDARGMIIAYATQPNQVAGDGHGRNSPFTAALLKEMKEPGLEIATFFRRVAADVDRATNGRQFPELSISMTGEFYLNTRETDLQAWARVRDSSKITDLNDFLVHYPGSVLAEDARARIAVLERSPQARGKKELRETERGDSSATMNLQDAAKSDSAINPAVSPRDGDRAKTGSAAPDQTMPVATLPVTHDQSKTVIPAIEKPSRILPMETKKEQKRVEPPKDRARIASRSSEATPSAPVTVNARPPTDTCSFHRNACLTNSAVREGRSSPYCLPAYRTCMMTGTWQTLYRSQSLFAQRARSSILLPLQMSRPCCEQYRQIACCTNRGKVCGNPVLNCLASISWAMASITSAQPPGW